MKKMHKAIALIMTLAMIICFPTAASAAPVDEATIDFSRTGSIDIFKYDLSNAEKDGVWDSSYVYVQCLDCGAHTAELSYRSEEERQDAARRVARNWNLGKVIYPGPGD